jgi:HlyD family secretion protein
MKLSRRTLIWLAGLALTVGVVSGAWALFRGGAHPIHPIEGKPGADGGPSATVAVKTIHPKRDPYFRISTEQLAIVEPFYQAGLRSRVPGVVKNVWKDIGEPVHAGELLAEIDVPDLHKELEQKEAVIEQRHREWKLAGAQVKNAEAAVAVANTMVLQRKAEVKAAIAQQDREAKRLARYRPLAGSDVVTRDAIDEQEKTVAAAAAAAEAAEVAVRKAEADAAEKQASLDAAHVDVELKDSLVTVARKDWEREREQVNYARITAPFDGVITRRAVDPGMFVANSATSNTAEPLLTVARLDLVTVTMKVPDNVAEFISRDTEAIIHLHDMPGVEIHGKLTRFTPVIDAGDRRVRVEVDLFNGSHEEYQQRTGRSIAAALTSLGVMSPLNAAASTGVDCCQLRLTHKGTLDAFPSCPGWNGGKRHLIPGMNGSMQLVLNQFSDAYLLPASAVFSVGGTPFILVVEDGRTRRLPVKVQVNDGKLVKLAVVESSRDPHGRRQESTHELTGNELIVASRQMEVGEGQRVKVVAGEW